MNDELETRRPVATRSAGWAKATASFLAKVGISPNVISIASIAFSLISLLAFYLDVKNPNNPVIYMVLAVIGIQGRLIMNLLDGMVAVEHNKKSSLGGLFNEVPDRISDALIIFGVGLAAKKFTYGEDLAYLAIILSTATAYIRTLGASLSCSHYFIGPMAKQHRMALITIGCIGYIFYTPIFYYVLILMNTLLLITCYRRLSKIVQCLNKQN